MPEGVHLGGSPSNHRGHAARRAPAVLAIALFLLPALIVASPASATHLTGAPATYTLNADFDEGMKVNVDHVVADQLQLTDTFTPFPFIWVAVSTKGTAVKIDTVTGAVLGEYLTSPAGMSRNPSRTTVDQNGNVWVTNRDEASLLNGIPMGSVVHLALRENGQCIDRNLNGVIDTSTGLGDVRAWSNAGGIDTDGGVATASDECILHFTRTHATNDRHVSITRNNDVWVSGTGVRAFDLISGSTGLIIRTEASVGCGGYGGLIDANGVIWSGSPFLRWDTALPLTAGNYTCGNWDSYGLCIDSQGNVWNTQLSGGLIRKFAPSGTLLGTYSYGNSNAQGCTVDRNDHIWVAHSLVCNCNTVGHLKNDGTFVGNVVVGLQPTGVSVDAAGKVWATNYASRYASRIDPAAGPLGPDGITRVGQTDLNTVDLGGNLYNYSDMTGSSLAMFRNFGTWTIIHDTAVGDAQWGYINWNASTPGNAQITVRAATSIDGVAFGPDVAVTNGGLLTVPDGQFMRVIVTFRRADTGQTPILYDLGLRIIPKTVAFQGICALVGTSVRGVEAQPLSFPVVAGTMLPGGTVTVTMLSGPAGLTFAPGPAGNPTTGTASWASPVAGSHLAIFQAVDNGGSTTRCRLPIVIDLPTGQARSTGVWVGTTVPATVEHQSAGLDQRSSGASNPGALQRVALVEVPLIVYADAVEERASIAMSAGTVTSTAASEIAEARLLGGLVVVKGLHQQTTLAWDRTRAAQVFTTNSTIAYLEIGGTPIALPAPGTPTEIALAGGGFVRLYERKLVDGADNASWEENIVHVYAPAAYGRHEVILGSVLVQAGVKVAFRGQARAILPQDDARSARDAGDTQATAIPLTTGVYDATMTADDRMDSYAFAAAHGEKIVFIAQNAPRATTQGGYAQLIAGTTPVIVPPTTTGPQFDSYSTRLYDPTGALRDVSEVLLIGVPARVELNADITGTWRVDVTHSLAQQTNYTIALTVTPLVLLPQADAGKLGDAPAACSTSDPLIPTVGTGAWSGVVRDNDYSDVYRLDARIGDLVTVALKPGEDADGVDMALTLYDRACAVLATSDANLLGLKGSPELVTRMPSQYTGAYYVRILRMNGVGNHYLVVDVADPMPTTPTNDALTGADAPASRASASPAPPGAFQGRIEEGDAGDAFLLPLESGRMATVTVHTAFASAFQVRLVDPAGNVVAPFTVAASSTVYRVLATGGNYGLELSASVGGGGYTVTWGQTLGPA